MGVFALDWHFENAEFSTKMAKRFLFSVLVSVLMLTSFTPVHRVSVKDPVYVYLCEGPASKVYHASPDCRGLSRCSTKIYKVTLAEAQKMGRRPCKIEYR
jgi:hypothetical protein